MLTSGQLIGVLIFVIFQTQCRDNIIYIERVIRKILELRDMGFRGEIEADGGIREDNLQRLTENGLTVAVMGTALFRSADMKAAIDRIHRMA